jgi:AAA family ATP:ADP antiporter
MRDAGITPRLFCGLCALAFTTMLSYAVAGSAAPALFLTRYGAQKLPIVWVLVAAASAVAVGGVNLAGRRLDVVQLFVWASVISAGALGLLLLLEGRHVPLVAYGLYVWKDIYIIVLVELFWTFANIAFGVRTATRTYGLFCAAGSMGGIVGSKLVGVLSRSMGTVQVLWLLLPILFVGAWGCQNLAREVVIPGAGRGTPGSDQPQTRGALREGLKLLQASPYLLLLMALVAVVQVVITLNEFQFSAAVEATFPDLDARTGAIADIAVIINSISFALQVATSMMLRVVGMPLAMLSIPVLLATSLCLAVARPTFGVIALCQVVGKCMDYSLFRACKEILYIPLSYAEKTQGKAFVDIFVYRVAKGGVGLFLLSLAGLGAHLGVRLATLALCGVWLALAAFILRRYRAVRPG